MYDLRNVYFIGNRTDVGLNQKGYSQKKKKKRLFATVFSTS